MTTRILKWFSGALALALLVVAPGVADAQTYYWWQAQDEYGQPYTGENVQCSVYRPNVHGAAILHANSSLSGSTASNSPLWSDATGKLHFYSSLDTTFDVTCWYTHGAQGFVGRLSKFDHKVVLPRSGQMVSRFAVNSTAATYQTLTGIIMPQGAIIRDVVVQNLNPQGLGQYHVSVGFAGAHATGAANALVSAQALSSPDEWIRPHLVLAVGGVTAIASGNHRGTALSQFHANISVPGFATDKSLYYERPYIVHVASGLEVTYSAQPGTSAGVRAHVFILWERFHSLSNRVPFGAGR